MDALSSLPMVQLQKLPVVVYVEDAQLAASVRASIEQYLGRIFVPTCDAELDMFLRDETALGVIMDLQRIPGGGLMQHMIGERVPMVCVGYGDTLDARVAAVTAGVSTYMTWPMPGRTLMEYLRCQHNDVRLGSYRVLAVTDAKSQRDDWLLDVVQDPRFVVSMAKPADALSLIRAERPETILIDARTSSYDASVLAVALTQGGSIDPRALVVSREGRGSSAQLLQKRANGTFFIAHVPSLADTVLSIALMVREARCMIGSEHFGGLQFIDMLAPDLIAASEVCRRHEVPFTVALVSIDNGPRIVAEQGLQRLMKVMVAMANELQQIFGLEAIRAQVSRDMVIIGLPGVPQPQASEQLSAFRSRFADQFEDARCSVGGASNALGKELLLVDLVQHARRALLRARLVGGSVIFSGDGA